MECHHYHHLPLLWAVTLKITGFVSQSFIHPFKKYSVFIEPLWHTSPVPCHHLPKLTLVNSWPKSMALSRPDWEILWVGVIPPPWACSDSPAQAGLALPVSELLHWIFRSTHLLWWRQVPKYLAQYWAYIWYTGNIFVKQFFFISCHLLETNQTLLNNLDSRSPLHPNHAHGCHTHTKESLKPCLYSQQTWQTFLPLIKLQITRHCVFRMCCMLYVSNISKQHFLLIMFIQ